MGREYSADVKWSVAVCGSGYEGNGASGAAECYDVRVGS